MARILAFCNMTEFTDNATNVTNTVGELSPTGLTYSTDVTEYSNAGIDLLVMRRSDITQAESSQTETVLTAVADAIKDLPNAFAVGTQTPPPTLSQMASRSMGNNIVVNSVGPGISNAKNSIIYPAYIDFNYSHTTGQTWSFRVWLADAVFIADYPHVDITVVPPIPIAEIDSIVNDWTTTRDRINRLSTSDLLANFNRVKGPSYVATQVNAIDVNIFNAVVRSVYYTSSWTYGINGNPSLVTDAEVYDAIRRTVLAGSSLNAATWLTYIPDFEPYNRYYIVPQWANVAISNQSLSSPIMSPTIGPDVFDTIIATYFPDETDAVAAKAALRYTQLLYKSAGAMVLAAPSNPEGRKTWDAKFPDYILVPPNDTAINQVHQRTRSVIGALGRIMPLADTYTSATQLSTLDYIVTTPAGRWLATKTNGVELAVFTRDQN